MCVLSYERAISCSSAHAGSVGGIGIFKQNIEWNTEAFRRKDWKEVSFEPDEKLRERHVNKQAILYEDAKNREHKLLRVFFLMQNLLNGMLTAHDKAQNHLMSFESALIEIILAVCIRFLYFLSDGSGEKTEVIFVLR